MSKNQLFVLALYFLLLVLMALLYLSADMLTLSHRQSVIQTAADAFKLTLGALLGALSASLGGRRDVV